MDDFLKFFAEKVKRYPMHIEIYYSKVMDWCINIYKKNIWTGEKEEEIVDIQNCDMELAFAKAQVELKKWFMENEGGY